MSASAPTPPAPQDQAFPLLTSEQIARVVPHGVKRTFKAGETLYEAGQSTYPFFVVISGELQAVRPTCNGEELITTAVRGSFSGEVNALSGRRPLVTLRATKPSEAVELNREQLLALIQTDAEISEILMRAFVLRRVLLLNREIGDALILGSKFSPRTLEIREFLARNAHPYRFVDLDEDPSSQEILDHFKVTADEIPIVICRGTVILRDPSNATLADCLGFNEVIDAGDGHVRDVVIVGAGPAGLGAAVYA